MPFPSMDTSSSYRGISRTYSAKWGGGVTNKTVVLNDYCGERKMIPDRVSRTPLGLMFVDSKTL